MLNYKEARLGVNNSNYKPELHVLETRKCACGCGQTFTCFVNGRKKCINKQHSLKRKRGAIHPLYKTKYHTFETRICACGCKEVFTCLIASTRKYVIQGHQNKNKTGKNHPTYNPDRHNLKTKTCACGCETTFQCPVISQQKYIENHNPKGENSSQWRGGITSLPYSTDWTETLRRSIRERDHYVCQLCNSITNGSKAFCVHHIDYNKLNCNPANLITLCTGCNAKVNFKREIWSKYFNLKTKAT